MHPILVEYGPILLSTLWVCVIIGFIASSLALTKFAFVSKLKIFFLRMYFFKILIWGVIFSRAVFILENLNYYFSDFGLKSIFKIISVWDKGLSFWGAVIGIAIAFVKYTKREGEPTFKWLDNLSISVFLGMVFGYIGAFFDGINYGTPTTLPWGVTFESIEIQYTMEIHPTQLYGALFLIILTAILAILFIKNKLANGNIMMFGIISYSVFRFFEEFLRGDEVAFILSLRYSQWISLIIFIISLIFLLNRYNLFDPLLRLFKKLKHKAR